MNMHTRLVTLIFSFAFMASAHAMRCGDKLVYPEDSQYDILSKCGEPLDKQIHEESIPLYNAAGYQIGVNSRTLEHWTYQRSSADFRYVLIFEDGVLKQINANRSP